MALTQTTPQQLQADMAAAYSASANLPVRTDTGSQFGPIFNAVALIAGMGLQAQIAYVYVISRLLTIPPNQDGSPNPDVDSFVAPFGFTRLTATYATGQCTFSTPSTLVTTLYIPVGTIVQTSPTTTSASQFIVIADTQYPNYSSTFNGYAISGGSSSAVAPVQALVAGTSYGNVQANTINQIVSGPGGQPPVGISGVNNQFAFNSAIDTETDAQLITRFTLGVSTGRVATRNAIASAILGVQAGLTYAIGDRVNPDGSSHVAYFTVVVAQFGSSSVAPIAQIATAIEGNQPGGSTPPVRPAGISYTIVSPSITPVNVSATITLASGTISATVITACTTAYNSYINGIGLDPLGNTTIAALGAVYAILYRVPGVQRVDNLLLNGSASDVTTSTFAYMLLPGTVSFST